MLRMNEAPTIEVHVVRSAEPPGGTGETGTPAIVPVIANAIFSAIERTDSFIDRGLYLTDIQTERETFFISAFLPGEPRSQGKLLSRLIGSSTLVTETVQDSARPNQVALPRF